MYPDGYPDFPMAQLLDTHQDQHRVTVSCLVSDLRFEWRLEPAGEGTRITRRRRDPRHRGAPPRQPTPDHQHLDDTARTARHQRIGRPRQRQCGVIRVIGAPCTSGAGLVTCFRLQHGAQPRPLARRAMRGRQSSSHKGSTSERRGRSIGASESGRDGVPRGMFRETFEGGPGRRSGLGHAARAAPRSVGIDISQDTSEASCGLGQSRRPLSHVGPGGPDGSPADGHPDECSSSALRANPRRSTTRW